MVAGEGTCFDPSPEGLEATETQKKESSKAWLSHMPVWPCPSHPATRLSLLGWKTRAPAFQNAASSQLTLARLCTATGLNVYPDSATRQLCDLK